MQNLTKRQAIFNNVSDPEKQFNATACFPNVKKIARPKKLTKSKTKNSPFPFGKLVRYVFLFTRCLISLQKKNLRTNRHLNKEQIKRKVEIGYLG